MQSMNTRESQKTRVLDEAGRRRRHRKQLEALEQDNFQEDPHANLQKHPKMPKFEDPNDPGQQSQLSRKRRKLRGEHSKQRFRKTLNILMEEEQERVRTEQQSPNYFSISAPPSRLPERHFCAVCGFDSNYTCVQCGSRYCSLKCKAVHTDTRCLKWTA